MTHAELSEKFKKYHQKTWPERRIFENKSGVAIFEDRFITYGIPLPLLGKSKKAIGGGGPDFFSFGNENGYFTVWSFEVKTLKDKMKPNQIRFSNYIIGQGGKYWVVKEEISDGFKLVALH